MYNFDKDCCECCCKCTCKCEKKKPEHCADQRCCRTPCDDAFWMVRPICPVCKPIKKKGCNICKRIRKCLCGR